MAIYDWKISDNYVEKTLAKKGKFQWKTVRGGKLGALIRQQWWWGQQRWTQVGLSLISSQALNILLLALFCSEEEHVLCGFTLFDIMQCIIRRKHVIDLWMKDCAAISAQCNECLPSTTVATVWKQFWRLESECWYCYQRGSHRLNGFIFTLVIRPLWDHIRRKHPRLLFSEAAQCTYICGFEEHL